MYIIEKLLAVQHRDQSQNKRFLFSNTYTQVQQKADVIWKFQRYQLIRNYEYRVPIPPPLSLVYVVNLIYFMICQCIEACGKQESDLNQDQDPEPG